MRGTVTALMVAVGCLFLSLAASVPADVPKAKPVVESKAITEIELPDLNASDTMSEEEFEKLQCDLLRNKLCDMPDDALADFLKKARRDYTLASEETEKRKPVTAEVKQVATTRPTAKCPLCGRPYPDPRNRTSAAGDCACGPDCPCKAEVVKSTENPTLYRTTTYQEQLQEVRGPMGFLWGYRRVSVPVETLSTTPPTSSAKSVTRPSSVPVVTGQSSQPKPVTQQPVRRFVQPVQNCPNGRCQLR